MVESRTLTPAERLRIALELFESGVAMMRETLKRRYPEELESQIEERLRSWIRERPGAEHGDCAGRGVDPKTRFP